MNFVDSIIKKRDGGKLTKEEFEIDSWIPVIESVKDWEKFGL